MKRLLDFFILKGSHGHSSQSLRYRLKQQILTGVSGFHFYISFSPVTVFFRCSFIYGGNDEDCGRRLDAVLIQGGLGKLMTNILFPNAGQTMMIRQIVKYTFL